MVVPSSHIPAGWIYEPDYDPRQALAPCLTCNGKKRICHAPCRDCSGYGLIAHIVTPITCGDCGRIITRDPNAVFGASATCGACVLELAAKAEA
jgi:hypothetical protein